MTACNCQFGVFLCQSAAFTAAISMTVKLNAQTADGMSPILHVQSDEAAAKKTLVRLSSRLSPTGDTSRFHHANADSRMEAWNRRRQAPSNEGCSHFCFASSKKKQKTKLNVLLIKLLF